METKRLLIVDDEDDFRQTIAKRLKKRGIVPEEAATGEECLSILEKEPIDVSVPFQLSKFLTFPSRYPRAHARGPLPVFDS